MNHAVRLLQIVAHILSYKIAILMVPQNAEKRSKPKVIQVLTILLVIKQFEKRYTSLSSSEYRTAN